MKMRFLMIAAVAASLWVLPLSMSRADWYDGCCTYGSKSMLAAYVDLYVCGWKGC